MSQKSKKDCPKWLADKEINPITNRKVSRNKQTETLISERKTRLINIQTDIERLKIPNDRGCVSGNDRLFREQFTDDFVSIGKGSFGHVYKAVLNGNVFAIKETKATLCAFKDKKNPYWEEHNILERLREIILGNVCQNFPLLYGVFFCMTCEIDLAENRQLKSPCFLTLVELMDGTLSKIGEKSDEQFSVIFQILAALHTLQKHYVMIQNDIKTENILISYVPPGGYWEYVIYNHSFFVPNYGVVAYVNDFGVAISFSPKYSTRGMLGERNAFVSNGIFTPFTTELYISSSGKSCPNKTKFNWDTDEKYTRNNFIMKKRKLFDVKPSFPIQLKDLEREDIVPVDFFHDTQDVIRLFVGGKRTMQPGDHPGIRQINPSVKKTLAKYKTERGVWITKWSLDSVHYFLAGHLIHKIFKDYKLRVDDTILESYRI